MKTHGALALAAAFVPLLMVVAGCGDTYACGGITGPRVLEGTLETRESEQQARARDAQDRLAAQPTAGDAGPSESEPAGALPEAERTVSAWIKGSMSAEVRLVDGARCEGPAPCVVLTSWAAPNVYIRWDMPQGPGAYELAKLHGEVCETVSVGHVICSALQGSLQVRTVLPPCLDGTCGHIDADFSLGSVAATTARGPTAAGKGSVYVDVYGVERTCHRSPVGGIPLGGLR
jgi:hypothetical protein